jgi:hypothetical protein
MCSKLEEGAEIGIENRQSDSGKGYDKEAEIVSGEVMGGIPCSMAGIIIATRMSARRDAKTE